MIIKGNNGKAPARKCQSVAASSSTKSKRSTVRSKTGNSESAGDPVLERGISEDTSGENLSTELVELTAITLHQPWASLVAKGCKQYETRDWPTSYRGPIIIHAGRKPKGKQELREHDKVLVSFKDLLNEDCPYSAVVAIAELTDVILMTEEFINQQYPTELRCGNWKIGRYAFKLENIRAIAPIPATGKQGLWKWNQEAAGFNSLEIYPLEPWNPTDFGEVQHKAGADGQLNLLEFDSNEPPEPDDYPGNLEAFKKAYLAWTELQEGTAEEEYQHITAEEIWNQSDNGNGSTCAQESAQGSPTLGLNVGDDRPTSLSNGTNIASQSSDEDSPTVNDLAISKPSILGEVNLETETSTSSQLHHPVNHSATTESGLEPTTIETVSPTYSEQLQNCSPTLQSLKTLPDYSLAPTPPATNQEVTSDSSSTPYPRAGTMRSGSVLPAPTLAAPGVESGSLLLRSPGALSGNSNQRPPGKNKLETQLIQLGLITSSEVANPEFLEAGYNLPVGWTNPQENRTALELAQVQAQQLPIAPSLELLQEMEATAIVESPSATPCIGQLPPSDLKELNISPALPALDNIGSFSKDDLLNFAITAHESIAGIERSELELAMRKLNQARIAGTCLTEFKKRCRHGEFGESVSTVINLRTAQTYMSIAENWNLLAEASRETLLVDGQTLGINWARDTIAQNKKSLKSAAPPKDPDGWRTPDTSDQPVVSLVKKALGGQIYLDPASDSGCNIPATMRYFKWNDGLAKHNIWEKTAFVNPPFSDPFPWVERCCLEIARGSVSAAIMLLKAGTISNVGTGELINKYASAICHWRGRINFLNDEGNAVKGSDFDCVFVYFGARLDLFRQAFGGRGTIATIENHYSSVNKKFMLPSEKPEFGNVEQEQKQLAAAVGLGNGRSVLPDMRDADRERMERYDPHTVVDVFSVPTMPSTIPAPPISENLVQSIAESEIFDETPLATRQFETAKQNTLNDYITAISGNLADFSDDQIAFLAKIINEESAKRIGF